MWIHMNFAGFAVLAIGSILLGYYALRRELNPWMWGAISFGVLFVCAVLIPVGSLLAILIGAIVMSVAISMASGK
ncbi:MAG TPA: hypothetical protein VG711_12370 [Phycisphaerales bacterium]|nr:hypothetical protein [Phycisphaerales bacterium]